MTLEYSHVLLTKQYRAVHIIDDLVFTVWYKDQVHSFVDPADQANISIAILVLSNFCKIDRLLTFLNVKKFIIRIDASQFKQMSIYIEATRRLCPARYQDYRTILCSESS